MNRIRNAAPDSANCDTCGEPNRTGDSVVFVSEGWCRRNGLTYSENLKMCIWCRKKAAVGGFDWITRPNRNKLPEVTSKIKRKKERRREMKRKLNHYKNLLLDIFGIKSS